MDIDVKAMAAKLVELRGNRTQDEVAEKIGVSRSALCMYESGQRIPRDPIKMRIAKYYGKSITSIFFIPKEHET